jgi:hypothetical protein
VIMMSVVLDFEMPRCRNAAGDPAFSSGRGKVDLTLSFRLAFIYMLEVKVDVELDRIVVAMYCYIHSGNSLLKSSMLAFIVSRYMCM